MNGDDNEGMRRWVNERGDRGGWNSGESVRVYGMGETTGERNIKEKNVD